MSPSWYWARPHLDRCSNNYISAVAQVEQVLPAEAPVAVQLVSDTPNIVTAGTATMWTATMLGTNPSSWQYQFWYARGSHGWSISRIFRRHAPSC